MGSGSFEFLVRHGYTVVFAAVLAEQLGLPIPAIPVLLAAGALLGAGKLSLGPVLGVALAGALVGDLLWYALGRRRGMPAVRWLCGISLEPDSCVRRTEEMFARHGALSLLFAKFVPGLSTVAPPLAGVFHMRLARFLALDVAGTLLWAGAFFGLGFAFADQLEHLAGHAALLGSRLFAILLGALLLYVAAKLVHRRRFLRSLRIARITPEELKGKLDAGEDVVVVDLRHSLDFEAAPFRIPGARRLDAARVEQEHEVIPRDREIVLYCT